MAGMHDGQGALPAASCLSKCNSDLRVFIAKSSTGCSPSSSDARMHPLIPSLNKAYAAREAAGLGIESGTLLVKDVRHE